MKQDIVDGDRRKNIPFDLKPLTIIVGHYGVGKTNLALNLAMDSADAGYQTSLVDLDIINPYFRSSDYTALLSDAGVNVVAPVFAGSSLDVPSLSGTIYPTIESATDTHRVILDVGGDDTGATALGRFVDTIKGRPHEILYVVNAYRNLTQTSKEATQMMFEIEARTGLSVTGIVNNSHLKGETSAKTIMKSCQFAEEVAKSVDLPLVATTIPVTILSSGGDISSSSGSIKPKSSTLLSSLGLQNPYVVQIYVRTPWEQ